MTTCYICMSPGCSGTRCEYKVLSNWMKKYYYTMPLPGDPTPDEIKNTISDLQTTVKELS